VAHESAITQGAQSVSCLHELESFFGVGQVLANKRTTTTASTCIATWCGVERI
jgi:hypothetical protein